jgi:hypothetical protein
MPLQIRIALLLLLERASAVPSNPAAGPLNVLDFGARGDGSADDSCAIQKALDAAQDPAAARGAMAGNPVMGRAVYFPAGTYLINTTLTVARVHSPEGTRPVRLFGDGMKQSLLLAGQEMAAVLQFAGKAPGSDGGASLTTNGHIVENLWISGAGLTNFSLAAPAITRSQVKSSMFTDARVAGLSLGFGWINEITQCYFKHNLIGLYLDNAINSVNVLDCNFESNFGVGVLVNSGASVRVEGSEFESQGGPAMIVNNVRALAVRSNYFEANNMQANVSSKFRFVDATSGEEEAVCTDVLLTGGYGWLHSASTKFPLLRLGPAAGEFSLGPIPLSNVAPSSGVVVESNYHNPGGDHCGGKLFAGVFAAGVVGLRAQASDCSGCVHSPGRVCVPVATGNAPHANSSLADFDVNLNTGDFASAGSVRRNLKLDDIGTVTAREARSWPATPTGHIECSIVPPDCTEEGCSP